MSRLIGRPVRDAQGEQIALRRDIIVPLDMGAGSYPAVIGLMARITRRDFFIPAVLLVSLDESKGAVLSAARFDLQPFARRPAEILLHEDLLDKQVIDLGGARVVRVADLLVDNEGGRYVLKSLEIGAYAIIRAHPASEREWSLAWSGAGLDRGRSICQRDRGCDTYSLT